MIFVENCRTVRPTKFTLGGVIRDPWLHETHNASGGKVTGVNLIAEFRTDGRKKCPAMAVMLFRNDFLVIFFKVHTCIFCNDRKTFWHIMTHNRMATAFSAMPDVGAII